LLGIAVDEEVFERWKKSKTRKRRVSIRPVGRVFLVIAVIASFALTFVIMFAKAPEKRIATVQGHIVKLVEQDWEEKIEKAEKKVKEAAKRAHDDADVDVDVDFDWPGRRAIVELDSGEKTDVAFPSDQEFRKDAAVKLDVYRKALGPLSMEFHKFAGYIDAAK
jgi:cell division protein FtsL